METQPVIAVGIMALPEIMFSLSGSFQVGEKHIEPGNYLALSTGGKIVVQKKDAIITEGTMIEFSPNDESCVFELKKVTVGIGFHWERKESQIFKGSLKLIKDDGNIRAINLIPLEEYLKCVISSEMKSTGSINLLKAHAVISRSWLLAQIGKSKNQESQNRRHNTEQISEYEIIRWYDRKDHTLFDVCADDHCQRYHGITKILEQKALEAVEETRGEVLVSEGQICDARYSKCCGGATECFENVWEPVHHPYLVKIRDFSNATKEFDNDLAIEQNAEKWIRNSPPAFCNTSDMDVLVQLLPGMDLATTDFYRWKIIYSQKRLSGLLKKRSGFDFGEIIKLVPVERGASGRLIRIKIVGTKKTLTVGKELEIRKWFSETHLYSSAFVVDHLKIVNGIPQKFILTGAGWGHGVGLCQIGAAMIGEKGFGYKQILAHYFKNAGLIKLYS